MKKILLPLITLVSVFTLNLSGQNGTMEAENGVIIGNNTGTDAGTVRWTGTDFEGYDGTQWISLTSNGAISSLLQDDDGDTQIDLEGVGDHDEIRLIAENDIVGRIDAGTNLSLGNSSIPLTSAGTNNTALGYGTLKSNTVGDRNTAVGFQALNNNLDGSQNVAIGQNALMNNDSGAQNTALGEAAALSLKSGDKNTVIGQSALRVNSSGSYNTAIGEEALYSSLGSNNTAVGREAGENSDNGGVFVGYRAGQNETSDNRLYIENSPANSTNALIYGEFDTDLLRLNGDVKVKNGVSFGNSIIADAGTVRWTGTDFEGYNGTGWISLTADEAILQDADADTRIDLEGAGDHDEIRMYAEDDLVGRIDGSTNLSLGNSSIPLSSTGINNSAFGYGTLQNNTSGSQSSAFGTLALGGHTKGYNNTAVGYNAQGALTSGNNNVAIGHNAGSDDISVSSRNVYLGSEAGGQTGIQAHEKNHNVMIGYQAGYDVQTDGNVMIGHQAGKSETMGDRLYISNNDLDTNNALVYGEFDNNFIRFNADVDVKYGLALGNSLNNTAGNLQWTGSDFEGYDGSNWLSLTKNVSVLEDADGDTKIDLEGAGDHDEIRMFAIGQLVGRIGQTSNLSLGRLSIPLTSTADFNTAVGFGSLSFNGSGEKNTAFGYHALNNNQSGSDNAAFGMRAGSKDDDFSSYNVYIGSGAGNHSSVTPFQKDRNVMIGYQAGYDVGTSGNVMIGYEAGKGEIMGDRLYISNDDSDKDNALIYGEFNNAYLRLNGRMHMISNSGSGTPQLQLTEYGADGARIILDNDQNDNRWTIFGRPYNTGSSSQINFHYKDNSGGDTLTGNKFRIFGDGDAYLYHDNIGSSGAGLRLINGEFTTEYWRLYTSSSNGDLRFYSDNNTSSARAWINDGTGAYSMASDERVKNNIQNLPSTLYRILLLSPKSYWYNGQSMDETKSLGFLAQDATELFPELVSYQEDDDMYGINYAGFSVVAIKAIQEQQEIIDNLQKDLGTQQRDLETQGRTMASQAQKTKTLEQTVKAQQGTLASQTQKTEKLEQTVKAQQEQIQLLIELNNKILQSLKD